MDLVKSMAVSASGMRAQGERMRVVAENLANAHSTARAPGDEPYRRKVVTFANELDRSLGATLVRVDGIADDRSEFVRAHDPGHPAADEDGYVLMPNVKSVIEMMDMRESHRSYEANINALTTARTMLVRMVDLLKP